MNSTATAAVLPSWSSRLLIAVRENHPQPLFFTLATLALDGSPRNRTVVCRRIDEQYSRIFICTSMESNKWKELERESRFEICWYFNQTREQFRFKGNKVEFFRVPQLEAQAIWDEMSHSARSLFNNISTGPNSIFGVIAFSPNEVELLNTNNGIITKWNL